MLNQSIGSSRDIHFDYPELHLGDDLIVFDFNGVIRLNRTVQGILAQGKFITTVPADCVRCLTHIDQPIQTEFSELYAFRLEKTSEADQTIPEDGNIDFADLVREYFWMEIPINPICKADCLGLCMDCGANLNEGLCEHHLNLGASAEES